MGTQENGSGMRWNLMSIPTDGSSVELGVRRGRFKEPPRVIPSAMPSGMPSILASISAGGESLVITTLTLKLKRKYAMRVSRIAPK